MINLGSFFDSDLTELGGVSQTENEKTSLQREGSLYKYRSDEMVWTCIAVTVFDRTVWQDRRVDNKYFPSLN